MGVESLVSICIPTFNGESFLRGCLESALSQTYHDIEVLVVDDGSSDNSFGIAQEYAASDGRIRTFRNERNLGLVGNWNQCALRARGEWIKFLHQDDTLEANCVERMLSVCGANTSMVVCKRNIIFEDDSKDLREDFLGYIQEYDMDRIFPGMTVIAAEDFCKGILSKSLGNFVGEPTGVLLHRTVFSRFGFFNPHLIQLCDLEYWVRVGSQVGLTYVPEVLAHFRRHSKGTTISNTTSRKFRVYLDEVVCYHDFVFHPLYAPLRFYASQLQPPVNLNQWFALKVKGAQKVARQAAKNHLHPDPSLSEEMTEMTRLFPGFRMVRKIPFSLRFGKYRWKIQDFLSSHLNIKK